jgi:hypothetical protein
MDSPGFREFDRTMQSRATRSADGLGLASSYPETARSSDKEWFFESIELVMVDDSF